MLGEPLDLPVARIGRVGRLGLPCESLAPGRADEFRQRHVHGPGAFRSRLEHDLERDDFVPGAEDPDTPPVPDRVLLALRVRELEDRSPVVEPLREARLGQQVVGRMDAHLVGDEFSLVCRQRNGFA